MVDEVKDRFHCANDKAMKLMRELDGNKGIGLIESVSRDWERRILFMLKFRKQFIDIKGGNNKQEIVFL